MRRLPLCAVLIFIGCKPAAVATIPSGPPSSAGWQIRYNAALAFAMRGSPQVKEPFVADLLLEMLDEQQQLINFTTTLANGQLQQDETAARTTVIGAMKAIVELHRKQPAMDLAEFRPAIEKLAQSSNRVLNKEAKQALLALQSPGA